MPYTNHWNVLRTQRMAQNKIPQMTATIPSFTTPRAPLLFPTHSFPSTNQTCPSAHTQNCYDASGFAPAGHTTHCWSIRTASSRQRQAAFLWSKTAFESKQMQVFPSDAASSGHLRQFPELESLYVFSVQRQARVARSKT